MSFLHNARLLHCLYLYVSVAMDNRAICKQGMLIVTACKLVLLSGLI